MIPWADIFASAKTSAAIGGTTTLSGVAFILNMIPDSIGKFAALVGAMLSLVMINYWRVQTKKAHLECAKFMRELERPKGE